MFKTGDKISYPAHKDIPGAKIFGTLLGIATKAAEVRTWIVLFDSPTLIEIDGEVWRGAIVPECLLSRE